MTGFRSWTREQPWLLWGSLACALVSTANAEYTLALATGMNPVVAGAVPGALDMYVVQALRQGRDVLPAVLSMVAVNVTSHLVHAGDLPMDWRIRSAVGSITALLLWRVHYLWKRRPRAAPKPLPTWEQGESAEFEPLPEWEHPEEHPPPTALHLLPPLPETFPAWEADAMSAPDPEPVLPGVLPLREHDESTAPEPLPEALLPGDAAHEGALRAYLETCSEEGVTPSTRGCKDFCKVGWDRAKRLMAHAGYPSKEDER